MIGCETNMPWVKPFIGYTDFSPSIPQLYWNVESTEQRYHLLCAQLHKLVCYADMLGLKLNIDHEAIENLEKEFEKFKDSGFIDYYEQLMLQWLDENSDIVWDKLAKMVFAGITLDGHFVIYIPRSWDDLYFDTIMRPGDDYGRLELYYYVNEDALPVEQP